jgi:hypothetical protein
MPVVSGEHRPAVHFYGLHIAGHRIEQAVVALFDIANRQFSPLEFRDVVRDAKGADDPAILIAEGHFVRQLRSNSIETDGASRNLENCDYSQDELFIESIRMTL